MPFGNSTISGQAVRDETGYNPVRSRLRPTDVPSGAGGGFTATISAQTVRSVTYAGHGFMQQAVLAGGDTLLIPVGTLTLTGEIPIVSSGLGIPEGALTLTGFLPLVSRAVQVPVGALALTGFAPLLSSDIAVQPGALTLTGFTPHVAVAVQVPEGAMTLAGDTPTITVFVPGHPSFILMKVCATLEPAKRLPVRGSDS